MTPGEFVARALDANLGAVPNALDTAVLHWRLYAALCDPALLTEPALAELHAYLADGDLFKPWTLAEALSAAFEKYQAWRCDWLLRWEAGADPDDPQAILWRHSVNGATHRARRIHDYLNRYGSGTAPRTASATLYFRHPQHLSRCITCPGDPGTGWHTALLPADPDQRILG